MGEWRPLQRARRSGGHSYVFKEPIEADENWVTMTLRDVVDYKKRRMTKDELFTGILLAIEETCGAVQVATASQEVTLMPGPAAAGSGD